MTSIIISGLLGKMGQTVLKCAEENEDIQVLAGVDIMAPDENPYEFPLYADFCSIKEKPDAVIDFSHPSALSSMLMYAKRMNVPVVLATTAYSGENMEMIRNASKEVPVFFSANMSLGVNLMKVLIKKAAEVLSDSFDIEITETHHNQKKDAPSGTALALADSINEVFKGEKEYVYGRTPDSGKREKKEIGIHALRGGTVVGEHEVLFFGNDEVIKISHSARSRRVFAEGALKAAEFLKGRQPGLYSMEDIISF